VEYNNEEGKECINADLDPMMTDALYEYYIVPAYTKGRYYHT